MSTIDIVFLVFIGIPTVYGLFRGLVRMVITFFSVTLGFFFASRYSGALAGTLKDLWDIGRAGDIAAFVICFFAVVIICSMIGMLIRKGIVGIDLGCLDRFLGACVGGIIGIAISFGSIFLIYSYFPAPEAYLGRSLLAPAIVDAGEYLLLLIPSEIEEDIMEEYERLKQLWESEKGKDSRVLST